jgi:hypothetical protein
LKALVEVTFKALDPEDPEFKAKIQYVYFETDELRNDMLSIPMVPVMTWSSRVVPP